MFGSSNSISTDDRSIVTSSNSSTSLSICCFLPSSSRGKGTTSSRPSFSIPISSSSRSTLLSQLLILQLVMQLIQHQQQQIKEYKIQQPACPYKYLHYRGSEFHARESQSETHSFYLRDRSYYTDRSAEWEGRQERKPLLSLAGFYSFSTGYIGSRPKTAIGSDADSNVASIDDGAVLLWLWIFLYINISKTKLWIWLSIWSFCSHIPRFLYSITYRSFFFAFAAKTPASVPTLIACLPGSLFPPRGERSGYRSWI